jgi:hypothetical protein
MNIFVRNSALRIVKAIIVMSLLAAMGCHRSVT